MKRWIVAAIGALGLIATVSAMPAHAATSTGKPASPEVTCSGSEVYLQNVFSGWFAEMIGSATPPNSFQSTHVYTPLCPVEGTHTTWIVDGYSTCMAPDGNYTLGDGYHPVWAYSCNGENYEDWYVYDSDPGYKYMFENVWDHECLWTGTPSADWEMRPCNSADRGQWIYYLEPT